MRTFGFQWHVTDRCNGRCQHCYQERFDGGRELSLSALREAAHRIFSALPERAVEINVTGGEPLLLPDLAALLEDLHAYPNLTALNLISNGTIATGATFQRLVRLPRLRALKISAESSDPAVNDALRGPGHLARLSANLPALAATGKELVLMLTLSRATLAGLEATTRWAQASGFHGVIYERFVPLGTGRAMLTQVLDAAQWAGVGARVVAMADALSQGVGIATPAAIMVPGDIAAPASSLAPRVPGATGEAPPAAVEGLHAYRAYWLSLRPEDREDPLAGALCNLGEDSMALMPDGTVYPCRRLPLPVGNLLREPFADILSRLAQWAATPVKPRLHGARCGACALDDCAGCRALAYALHGEPLADDPHCTL